MEQIEVRILDREYRLAVPAEERERLLQAVRMLDKRMRTLRDQGRVTGLDRIAVMAALQFASELIGTQDGAVTVAPVDAVDRLRMLVTEVNDTLDRHANRKD